MTDPLEELLTAAERDELAASQVERALGGAYSHEVGVEMPPALTYGSDDLGCARYRADLARQRLDWLERRYQSAETKRRWREESAAASRDGLNRLLPPGRSLNDLVAATRSDPVALAELREAKQRRVAYEQADLLADAQVRVEARKS